MIMDQTVIEALAAGELDSIGIHLLEYSDADLERSKKLAFILKRLAEYYLMGTKNIPAESLEGLEFTDDASFRPIEEFMRPDERLDREQRLRELENK